MEPEGSLLHSQASTTHPYPGPAQSSPDLPLHNINTRNKSHPHKSNATLSCVQKSTFYAGIKIFNSLPPSVTILENDKAKFKAA